MKSLAFLAVAGRKVSVPFGGGFERPNHQYQPLHQWLTSDDVCARVSARYVTRFAFSLLPSTFFTPFFFCVMSEGWNPQSDIKFVVKGDFKNLRASVNDGSSAAFMWYTQQYLFVLLL
jgi:hypothetical protein